MRWTARLACALCVCAGLLPRTTHTQGLAATDWPEWRGQNRDAAVLGFTPPARWPDQLTRRWQVEVGLGYATPLVVGSRVYMWARQGEDEVMAAHDAATGAVLWRAGAPATFTMNSGASRHGPGQKSTPAFSDGRLFAIGMTGTVTAFDAATGAVAWQKPGTGILPTFTTHAFSPLVDRGLVVFHVGGNNAGALTAFDVNTGDVRWSWAGDGPGYGSPILAEIDGTRQIITLTQRRLIGVDAAAGTLLWERPYTTPSVTNAQTPSLSGRTVILGDASHPLEAFTVTKKDNEWITDLAWLNPDVPMRLSNAALVGRMLVGMSTRNAGQYFAIDPATGRTLWTSPERQAAQAAIVTAGSVWFSLEDDGELVVVRTSGTAFEPLQRYKVSDTPTWSPPVISGHRVFTKDQNTLALWTVN
jgi:outer membrane protein assembly factor BamB